MLITCYLWTDKVPVQVEDEFCTLGGTQEGRVSLEFTLPGPIRLARGLFTTTRIMNKIETNRLSVIWLVSENLIYCKVC